MKLSIIIPSYNYGHYLPRTIESILSQHQDEIEIIIIDDGSTDQTSEIIKPYLDQFNQISYYYQNNQGPAKARNHGLSYATGDYIMMLDADDELTVKSLHHIKEAITEYPTYDGFIFSYFSQQEDGKRKLSKPFTLQDKERNFLHYLKGKISIGAGSFVLKKQAWQQLRYPENIKGREDQVVFALMFALFNLKNISQPTVITHRHRNSLRNQTQSHTGQTELINAIFENEQLPLVFKKYKKLYESLLSLSLFRSHLIAGEKKTARQYYYQALKTDWKAALCWNYLRKFLRAF